MAEIFARKKLAYDMIIRARFGTTVCALVKAGLGIGPSRMAASPVSTADRLHRGETRRPTVCFTSNISSIACVWKRRQAGSVEIGHRRSVAVEKIT
jgi:hypothetical protein